MSEVSFPKERIIHMLDILESEKEDYTEYDLINLANRLQEVHDTLQKEVERLQEYL